MNDTDPRYEGARLTYDRGELDVADVAADPLTQLRRWLDEATDAGVTEPTAMVVSSVDADGRPTSRAVLMRSIDGGGLSFFTNLDSAKGLDLRQRPGQVCALFPWFTLQRQVRIDGHAELVDDADADAYFASRPRGSQVGAWASPQSDVIPDRAHLEQRVADAEARFDGIEVPRPPNWGGFRIIPEVVEFWQGRPSRLHDRIRYRIDGSGWVVERLAP